jgi:CheY-specific phosphatase CheX
MSEDIRHTAISVTSRVFETMFFIPLELPEESSRKELRTDAPSSPVYRGEIEFQGKHSGKLMFYLPSEFAKTMASNFMGLKEETASESQSMDVVAEVCNVVCGNLLCELDRKAVWNLALPRIQSLAYQEMEEAKEERIALDFIADGYEIKLIIQLDT